MLTNRFNYKSNKAKNAEILIIYVYLILQSALRWLLWKCLFIERYNIWCCEIQ